MKTAFSAKKMFFTSFLICLAMWTVAGLLLWFIFNKKTESAILAEEIFSMSSSRDKIKTLAQELSLLEGDLNKLDAFIIEGTQDGVVEFLRTLENASEISQTEISIDSVNVSQILVAGEPKDNFEYLNLKLGVTGGWDNIFHFLNLIENLQYQINIKELTFSFAPPVGEISRRWEGFINMEILRIK